MCQKHLFTAVSGETKLLHNLGLFRLGYYRAVKVGALSVAVALELLKTALIVQPLVGQKFPAIHASDGNNHLPITGGDSNCVKFAVAFPNPLNRDMTSAIGGSGRNTQLGAMDRALKQDRAIQELRTLVDEVKSVPAQLEELKMTVDALFNRVNSLNIPRLEPAVSVEQIQEIEAKLDALRVLQGPQITMSTLNALEKRLDTKITALEAALRSPL